MENRKLERAKKRLEQLKGFYIHFSIYLTINAIILTTFYSRSMESQYEFWSFPTFFTAIFWGVGVALHAAHTFQILPFYQKSWERRQMEKFMQEDKGASEKYN